jgi:hypothetical protein
MTTDDAVVPLQMTRSLCPCRSLGERACLGLVTMAKHRDFVLHSKSAGEKIKEAANML